MNSQFAAMSRVRSAYAAVLQNPGDVNAQAAFQAAHQAEQNTYVDAFDVGGISYPRSDGHKMSEREARAVISKLLTTPGEVLNLRPSVIEAAYPLEDEVLRDEINGVVALARDINRLDWRTDTLDAKSKEKIRELLRMPTLAGAYKAIKKTKSVANRSVLSIYRGYDADHLIRDEVLRGMAVRKQSSTLDESFATYLQDSQNKGSQHRYVTEQQDLALKKLLASTAKPTLGAYLEHVFVWMTHVYTTADLGVDVAIKKSHLGSGDDFARFSVKGFALTQAGYMTWPERQEVGRAVALALMIEARDFYAGLNKGLDYVLPIGLTTTPGAQPAQPSPLPSAT